MLKFTLISKLLIGDHTFKILFFKTNGLKTSLIPWIYKKITQFIIAVVFTKSEISVMQKKNKHKIIIVKLYLKPKYRNCS